MERSFLSLGLHSLQHEDACQRISSYEPQANGAGGRPSPQIPASPFSARELTVPYTSVGLGEDMFSLLHPSHFTGEEATLSNESGDS